MKPALHSPQNQTSFKHPILVIDRGGLIGEVLSLKLSKDHFVFFATNKNPDLDLENKNILHVQFSGKFPSIPDNKYSHIVFIDEDGDDLEFLPKLIEKVKSVNAEFIFAQGLTSERKYVGDKILRLYPSAKIVIYGDIFDDKLILGKDNFKSTINKFIYQAQRFGKIQVLDEGLRDAYPVFLDDVVDELISLALKTHKSNNSLFYLFPQHPPTELSLAHMIQKINPEIMVDFVRYDQRHKAISYPSGGEYLLSDKYPLAQKIRKIDIKKKIKIGNRTADREVKKVKSSPFFLIWIFIFLLLSPLIFTILFSFLGKSTFHYAENGMVKNNYTNVKSSLRVSQAFFYLGKQAAGILFLQAKILGQDDKLRVFSQEIDSDYKLSQGLSQAFSSADYFSKIFSGQSKNPTGDFVNAQNNLKTSIVALDKLKAEKISAPILQNLEKIYPLIRFLSATSDIAQNILGIEGERTYLILLQNNLELRPGGGVIDAYGILKFSSGKITQFTIHDISDADNQLRGHVEPPFELRRYLPDQHWYMKDSNFDVDFVKSASIASNFLFVETGQKADGVIAVDTSFIKSILHAIGSVYLADSKETIDENNWVTFLQKKNSLKSLGLAMISKISSTKAPFLLIAQAISDSLSQKHLLLNFKDSQNIFTVNGWSSSLWDERQNSKNLVNDFIGINEANLGLNNVNNFIARQILQNVAIEDSGNISEELVINYKNASPISSGGDYKNYLRVILPNNVKLSEISINDIARNLVDAITNPLLYEAKNFKAPDGLEVEKTSENGKTIFGFLVNVPVGEITKIKLKYMLGMNIFGLNNFTYSLKLFKQPGIDGLPYSFSLTYPTSFSIIKNSSGISVKARKASYFEKIVKDKNLIIDFAKK